MDVKEKAAKLKAELEKRAQEGKRGRFSEAMKAEVLEYWRQCKQAGATQETVARELGLSPWTLSHWSVKARRTKRRTASKAQQEVAAAPAFHAVKVKPMAQGPGRGVVLHGPSGVRVEGLSVSEVVRVPWRARHGAELELSDARATGAELELSDARTTGTELEPSGVGAQRTELEPSDARATGPSWTQRPCPSRAAAPNLCRGLRMRWLAPSPCRPSAP